METGVKIRVRGQVQGVGFRPFIWQLAQRFDLRGQVLNDPEGVLIFACGDDTARFTDAIRSEAPPLARVDAVETEPVQFEPGAGFEIAASQGAGAETRVTPDAATCAACLSEIRDPKDRRFGYAFANCTHCGPRFTILRALPYDRAQTTMAPFELCAECQSEYDTPADRRFHAQPVACPKCGPRLWIEPGQGGDPLEEAAHVLRQGGVLAVKGLGGFHLAVDATNSEAISLLRQRKHRPAKPFALMATLEIVGAHSHLSDQESALLQEAAAPIVLLERKSNDLPDELAPGQSTLGWMLPYTPLHHLLLDKIQRPLVMTSGNLSGEPQVIGNDEARDKLGAFADAFLMHDREIARRLDDSVERVTPHGRMVLRRARGRVPGTLPLPQGFEDCPPITAYGGQMKAAICLIKNGQALLGHHLGELDEALTWDAFCQADRDYAELFDQSPEIVACDLHPEFRASQYVQTKGVPVVPVQHHHAHLAACLAENGWPLDGGKVAGIILDGIGLGTDGTVWGGEVLLGDYRGFERRAWLKPAPLIGGDMASREPWRNALVRLDGAGLSKWADILFADQPLEIARQAAASGLNSPVCSSVGRLFDAVAAVLENSTEAQSFEGQAAMRLETLAQPSEAAEALGIDWAKRTGHSPGPEIETDVLFRRLIRDMTQGGQTRPTLAFAFHQWLVIQFALRALRLVRDGEAQAVVLSGGCFQNALLLDLTVQALGDVPVLIHTKTPANDGGLALGQAVVAAAKAVSR
ncbi:carbamoyltransferase HypF [Tropicibacter sp. R15_0]|uniref:carbamoyltransferase HypF n=1 Tax=Tropicibacter sp. R15_0 TaxID=2821101 RepID=UPI001ADD1553|nr:carbamoyltransferase HypF [Tropicibacter sp. R15_0]MBO9467324.1 carbamoyltransferase HypF [Tropicibacter sp. R15_0]